MEETQDIEKIILENIENTYLVKLISGQETSKGSFWANDELGKEFYICEGLVKENKEQLQGLKTNRTSYWALVQDIVWNGSEWSGNHVSSLLMFAIEKLRCELFKKTLKEHWELNFAQRRKIDEAIDLVSKNPFNKVYEQLILESEHLNEKSRHKVTELSNICRGWQDIER